jgi:cytochrome c oxidase subunit 2
MKAIGQMLNNLMREMLFLPEQASTFATKVDYLHYFVIIITMLASTLVGLLAVSFFFKYRETKVRRLHPRSSTPAAASRW